VVVEGSTAHSDSEEEGVAPDQEDLTYAAALWTSDSDRLLLVEQDC
jgi:hypothetical protein